jgi:phosphoadenosine phosphosulfate reductase
MNAQEWNPASLQQLSKSFENASPREILQWGLETFGQDLVMATGFGVSGIVLMHHLSRLAPQMTVFYLETDLLFEETYALRDQLAERLDIEFTPVHGGISLERQAREHGENLWARNPDQCCFIRKVLPLRRFLSDKKAWVTGLRRDQSVSRAGTDVIEWDHANGLVKLNPLAMWTRNEVWQYIKLN